MSSLRRLRRLDPAGASLFDSRRPTDDDVPVSIGRVRVAVYVTRDTENGREVLVFDHGDHAEAGTQIPAGGVEDDERLSDAAAREVLEETGLTNLSLCAARWRVFKNGNTQLHDSSESPYTCTP